MLDCKVFSKKIKEVKKVELKQGMRDFGVKWGEPYYIPTRELVLYPRTDADAKKVFEKLKKTSDPDGHFLKHGHIPGETVLTLFWVHEQVKPVHREVNRKKKNKRWKR